MTSWPDARALAYSAAKPLPAVELPLAEAGGCVLAAPLVALTSVPTYDGSAMDGWAVRGPGPWRVVGRVLAGDRLPGPLEPGTAVEVATGAPLPGGCEGVIPCELGILGVELTGAHPAGRHVRSRGEQCQAGELVLPAGTVLRAAALGLAAAIGYDVVPVHPRPRVLSLVTGTEVVKSGLPGPGQVRDAVGPLLAAHVEAAGGVLVGLEHLHDDEDLLRTVIGAADAQVVVTCGASSIGPADHLGAVLAGLGAELLVDGVAVRPGHPQVLARLPDGRFVVGLPGNPLAAVSGLVTLLAPLLAAQAGRPAPALVTGRAAQDLAAHPSSGLLVPVSVEAGAVTPTGHDGSAMLRGAAVADGFAVVPAGEPVKAGADVRVVPLP